MAIKIMAIHQLPIHLVTTDHHPFGFFRRLGVGQWECLFVDRWEPEIVRAGQLEDLFQQKMKGGN